MERECKTTDIYITEKEAARLCGMSEEWLRKQRRLGQGPPFVRFGRAIRYSQAGLWTWSTAQLRATNLNSKGGQNNASSVA
jgi:predicted DNA-binding transcriptional regulator AlpA